MSIKSKEDTAMFKKFRVKKFSFKKFKLMLAIGALVMAAFIGGRVASAGGLGIWTNSSSYAVGQPVQWCYTVPAPGFVAIDDITPDGRTTRLLSGFDDGTGDCLWSTATPPTGHECLRITFEYFDGAITATTTCFDVSFIY